MRLPKLKILNFYNLIISYEKNMRILFRNKRKIHILRNKKSNLSIFSHFKISNKHLHGYLLVLIAYYFHKYFFLYQTYKNAL